MNSDDFKVELWQVEALDYSILKTILNRDISKFLNIHKLMNDHECEAYINSLISSGYLYTIKVTKHDDFAKHISGLCGISDIDWISRTANLMFLMTDKHSNNLTISNNSLALVAFKSLLSKSFLDLNLAKVSVESNKFLNINFVLESLNFVAEGIRREHLLVDGEFIDSIVFSLLKSDYKG